MKDQSNEFLPHSFCITMKQKRKTCVHLIFHNVVHKSVPQTLSLQQTVNICTFLISTLTQSAGTSHYYLLPPTFMDKSMRKYATKPCSVSAPPFWLIEAVKNIECQIIFVTYSYFHINSFNAHRSSCLCVVPPAHPFPSIPINYRFACKTAS